MISCLQSNPGRLASAGGTQAAQLRPVASLHTLRVIAGFSLLSCPSHHFQHTFVAVVFDSCLLAMHRSMATGVGWWDSWLLFLDSHVSN